MQAIAIIILAAFGIFLFVTFVVRPIAESFWEIGGGIAFFAMLAGMIIGIICLIVYASGSGNSDTHFFFVTALALLLGGLAINVFAEKRR